MIENHAFVFKKFIGVCVGVVVMWQEWADVACDVNSKVECRVFHGEIFQVIVQRLSLSERRRHDEERCSLG